MQKELLLVEDDEVDILAFQRIFKKNDIRIPLTIARDGLEALKLLRYKASYHFKMSHYIIVTDINMPGMSGHELIAQIRNDPSLENSIIFVVSSSDLQQDMQQAYQNKIAGYFIKDDKQSIVEGVKMLKHYCNAIVM